MHIHVPTIDMHPYMCICIYIKSKSLFIVFRLLEVDSELVRRPTFNKLLVSLRLERQLGKREWRIKF